MRPGVATTSSTPSFKALTCLLYSTPPYMATELNGRYLPSFSASSATWVASSLVGTITRALGFPVVLGPAASSLVKMVRRKTAVFPDPVCDCAMTSLPAMHSGKACSCMGVHCTKPASCIPFRMSG